MAFIPGFEHDIFISYSHTDNLISRPNETHWVDQFHMDLEVGLARLNGKPGKVKIYRDTELDGSQLFDEVIQKRINQSAIFLALYSPGYKQSDYCRQELKWFYQKAQAEQAGLHAGERKRIVNVSLYKIPHDEWFIELDGTTGFPFYVTTSKEGIGKPLDFRSRRCAEWLKGSDGPPSKFLALHHACPQRGGRCRGEWLPP